jgi:hypothetical protein
VKMVCCSPLSDTGSLVILELTDAYVESAVFRFMLDGYGLLSLRESQADGLSSPESLVRSEGPSRKYRLLLHALET